MYTVHVCVLCVMYMCLRDVIIAVPGQVDNVSIACGPVGLINRCTVTWNVSMWNNFKFIHTWTIFVKFLNVM